MIREGNFNTVPVSLQRRFLWQLRQADAIIAAQMKRQVNLRLPAQFFIRIIRARPLTAFFVALVVLLGIIVAGNKFQKPGVEVSSAKSPKNVDVYTIGKTPTIKVQAQIQKDGVITIVAQGSGIVQKIAVGEGDTVARGQNLVALSTNYQGGNAPSLSRQLAQVQFQNISDNFDKQKDTIQKQRDLANKNSDNIEQLRQISEKSKDDTNSLLNINQDIVNTLNTNLQNLIGNNTNGQNDQLILATKQQIATFQSAANQLNANRRNLSYSTNTDNSPTQIANLGRDIALRGLDVQEKSLELSKQVAQIQLNLAQVNEALMFPAAVCPGVVQRVHVHVGQMVSAGTPLVTIYNERGNVSAVARVNKNVALSASRIDASNIYIGERVLVQIPRFVSTQATDGQLYSIIYDIGEDYQDDVTNMGYVTIAIPVGHTDSNSVVPFIPVDAVFQTQDSAFVYVVAGQEAAAKKVELGEVVGRDVAVRSGLADGDEIILNRNIVAGDSVTSSH